MVNTARQGAAFERRVIHDLEPHGYDCIRSAASKGAVDIVAVAGRVNCGCGCGVMDGTLGPLLFIQCKLSDPQISPRERLALLDLSLRAGALPVVCHWAKSATTGLMAVHYRVLTGPGPKEWEHWTPGEDD